MCLHSCMWPAGRRRKQRALRSMQPVCRPGLCQRRTAMVQAWWEAQSRCGTGCGVCWPVTHLLLGVLLHLVLGVKVRHSVGALQQAGEGGAAVSGVKIRQRSATFEAEPFQGCARVRPTNKTARAVQQRHTEPAFAAAHVAALTCSGWRVADSAGRVSSSELHRKWLTPCRFAASTRLMPAGLVYVLRGGYVWGGVWWGREGVRSGLPRPGCATGPPQLRCTSCSPVEAPHD